MNPTEIAIMPRRTVTPRRSGPTYGDGHRQHLLAGCDFFGDGFGQGCFFRRDDAERAWKRLREELLAEHIGERPCSRPWAWWEFEGHPPRRVVRPRPEDILPPPPARPYPWGKAAPWWDEARQAKWYEPQAGYLRRHGLLTRAEAEYLDRHPELLRPVTGYDVADR
jgi:hypothetical protein